MKNPSERKFPCMVQSKIKLLLRKLAYYQENQPAFVIEFIINSNKFFFDNLIDAKMKMSMF